MTRTDSPRRLDHLRRLQDTETVASELRTRQDEVLGADARLLDVRGWRLYPLRRGGFAVGYRVTAGLADQSPREMSVYGLVEDPGAGGEPSSTPGVWIDSLCIRLFQPEGDPRLKRLAAALRGEGIGELSGVTGDLAAYRPLARAAIRFERPGRGVSYLRISASKTRYERVRNLAELAGETGLFPRVLGASDRLRGVLVEGIDGATLHGTVAEADDAWMIGTAHTLGALHTHPPRGLPVHSPIDEAEATSWMVRRGSMAMPEVLRVAEEPLSRIFEAAAGMGCPAPTMVHRDLHDKQLVRTPRGDVMLLDSDTLACGDPALDVANLANHLRLRAMFGRLEAGRSESLVDVLVASYPTHGRTLSPASLEFYGACTWLRLAGVYALRSHGQRAVAPLISRCVESLDRLDRLHNGESVVTSPHNRRND